MKYGLSNETIFKTCNVIKNYSQIEEVILYGSRAKGNFKQGSDIDLTLVGEGLDLTTLNKLANELDDLLLPYTFDLSIHSSISNKNLLDHIDRVGLSFFKSSAYK